jgi:hypothetical protein
MPEGKFEGPKPPEAADPFTERIITSFINRTLLAELDAMEDISVEQLNHIQHLLTADLLPTLTSSEADGAFGRDCLHAFKVLEEKVLKKTAGFAPQAINPEDEATGPSAINFAHALESAGRSAVPRTIHDEPTQPKPSRLVPGSKDES